MKTTLNILATGAAAALSFMPAVGLAQSTHGTNNIVAIDDLTETTDCQNGRDDARKLMPGLIALDLQALDDGAGLAYIAILQPSNPRLKLSLDYAMCKADEIGKFIRKETYGVSYIQNTNGSYSIKITKKVKTAI